MVGFEVAVRSYLPLSPGLSPLCFVPWVNEAERAADAMLN